MSKTERALWKALNSCCGLWSSLSLRTDKSIMDLLDEGKSRGIVVVVVVIVVVVVAMVVVVVVVVQMEVVVQVLVEVHEAVVVQVVTLFR